MAVGTQIDRHAVGEEGDVRPMIGIEAAQKVLVRFPRSAGMFDREKSWNQSQHLSRAALRLKQIFFIGNELLRRGRHWALPDDRDLGNLQLKRVWIVGQSSASKTQHRAEDHQGDPV